MDAHRTGRVALMLVLTFALAVALGGCQRAAERVVEEATGVRIDEDGDSVTITGPEGEQAEFGASASLPEGWPEDHPVYEPADIESSMSFSGDDGAQYTVYMTTSDAFADVLAWYKQAAVDAGWTIESEGSLEMDGTNSGYFYLNKGNANSSVSVTQGENGEDVMITMIVTVK
jgi:hypothetical protein